jgi:hypothetical protein
VPPRKKPRIPDRGALATAAQRTTRFSLILLDALDLVNDTVANFSVVEGAGVVASSDAAVHQQGRALDIRPQNATAQRDWFTLFDVVRRAATTLSGSHGPGALTVDMFQDPAPPTRRQAGVTPSSTELLRRLNAATGPTDPRLTAAPPASAPNLVTDLPTLRLHLTTHGRFVSDWARASALQVTANTGEHAIERYCADV